MVVSKTAEPKETLNMEMPQSPNLVSVGGKIIVLFIGTRDLHVLIV